MDFWAGFLHLRLNTVSQLLSPIANVVHLKQDIPSHPVMSHPPHLMDNTKNVISQLLVKKEPGCLKALSGFCNLVAISIKGSKRKKRLF